jgi:hypothetical protein
MAGVVPCQLNNCRDVLSDLNQRFAATAIRRKQPHSPGGALLIIAL